MFHVCVPVLDIEACSIFLTSLLFRVRAFMSHAIQFGNKGIGSLALAEQKAFSWSKILFGHGYLKKNSLLFAVVLPSVDQPSDSSLGHQRISIPSRYLNGSVDS